MAVQLTLVHAPGLPTRSTRIVWLLEELGLPYKVIPVKFDAYSEKSEFKDALEDKSPLRTIPALLDGDTWIVESGAIAQYILARYGEGKLTPAINTVEYGLYLQWLWFAEASLAVWAVEYETQDFAPADQKVEAVLPVMKQKVLRALAVLDKALEGKQYILGNEFTAADIFLAHTLVIVDQLCSLLDKTTFPSAAAYLSRLIERPAAKKAYSP
eukprot:jgi/Botrbrau1/11686/Bobra.0195s0017.1